MKAFLLLATLIILEVPALAVMNGTRAKFSETFAMKEIQQKIVRVRKHYPNGTYRDCTGVIMNQGEVLTAAHCFLKGENANTSIRVKDKVTVSYHDPKSEKMIDLEITDGRLLRTDGTDLALMKFRGDSASNMSLPIAYQGCDTDEYFVAGYGVDSTGDYSTNLQVAKLHKQKSKKMSRILVQNRKVDYRPVVPDAGDGVSLNDSDENQITTYTYSNARQRVCFGDSGAPIFCRSKGQLAIAGVLTGGAGSSINPKAEITTQCRTTFEAYGTSAKTLTETLDEWRRTESATENLPTYSFEGIN